MRLLRTMIYVLCTLLAADLATAAGPPMSARETVDSIVTTISMEKKGLKSGTAWEREQSALNERIRQATLEKAWYDAQVKTLGRYAESARQRVDELQRQQVNLRQIETKLESELIAAVDQLAALVRADLPFLPAERADRLAFLRKTVGDYDLDGAEKLRRVLEGLQVELAYGKTVEVTREKRAINDVNQSVRCLRVGRMGLYALSPDNARAWRWRAETGFTPLAQDDVAAVGKAIEMMDKRNITFLPLLPVEVKQHVSNR